MKQRRESRRYIVEKEDVTKERKRGNKGETKKNERKKMQEP